MRLVPRIPLKASVPAKVPRPLCRTHLIVEHAAHAKRMLELEVAILETLSGKNASLLDDEQAIVGLHSMQHAPYRDTYDIQLP